MPGNEPILALGALWSKEFGNALEAMADERPELEARSGPAAFDGAAALKGDAVWWKQVLDASPGSAVWIGASRAACTVFGQRILSAAGIDSSDAEEQKNAYLEVVRQSLGSFASVIGAQIGREIASTEGAEEEPPHDKTAGCEIVVKRPDGPLPPLIFLINRELLTATSRPAGADQPEALLPAAATEEPAGSELSTRAYSTLSLLLDVELPVSVSFGRSRVRMQEILKLITGSIIELDRSISEPVEVIVNNCVVARGEVVVVDGNYGVRINEVMSRTERLQESRRFLLPIATHRR